MEFREVVRRRRMVRRYTGESVPREVLDRMVAHATHAPSAGFSQGWAFLVLDSAADLDRFWRATTPERTSAPTGGDDEPDDGWLAGMRTAPAVVVPLSNKAAYLDRYAETDKGWTDREETRWPVPYWHVDTGMAALLILQTAVDEGLGACFFGIPPERIAPFRDAFGVPADYTPIGAITVGHAAGGGAVGSPARRQRREVDEVLHHSRWRD